LPLPCTVEAEHADVPFVGGRQAEQDANGGGLAGAVFAQQRNDDAWRNLE
jgi:hypothetical protein